MCLFFVLLPLDETLYSRAHCADCELCLAGHDVGGLDVAVIHGVLERGSPVRVLVAHIAIEGDFGSSSGQTNPQKNAAIRLEHQNAGYFHLTFGMGMEGKMLNIEIKMRPLNRPLAPSLANKPSEFFWGGVRLKLLIQPSWSAFYDSILTKWEISRYILSSAAVECKWVFCAGRQIFPSLFQMTISQPTSTRS